MSPSVINNSIISKNHKIDNDNVFVKISSTSLASKTDSEYENEKIYRKKKRYRNDNHTNTDDYNNKDGIHRVKRQALNVEGDHDINNICLNQIPACSKSISNSEKRSISKNDSNGSNFTNIASLKYDSVDITNFNQEIESKSNAKLIHESTCNDSNDENINNANKSVGNSYNYNGFNKKKYNNNSEKSRFWSIRNSSNSIQKIDANKIPQGGNDLPNQNRKKHSFLKKNENTISKNKIKPISIMAAAAAVNQTNLSPNTKMTVIQSLNKDLRSKKLSIHKSIISSNPQLVHTKSHYLVNSKTNAISSTNNSNSNHSSPSNVLAPTVSIRSMVTTKEAGVIIGREGKNVSKIREISGAKVTVSEHVSGTLDRIITVSGEIDKVVKAFYLLTKRVVVEFEKEKLGFSKVSELTALNKDHDIDNDNSNDNYTINDSSSINEKNKPSNSSSSKINDTTIQNNNINNNQDTNDNDWYQINSHGDDHEEINDIQVSSKDLNNDDITTVLNTMNATNINDEDISIMKNATSENVDDNIQDMELENEKNNIDEDNDNDPKELYEEKVLSLRILVPDARVGSIIGKGGIRIKEIQEKSNATIIAEEDILPNSTEKVLTINGTVEAIRIAIYNIGNILRENTDKHFYTKYFKPIPMSFHQNPIPSSFSISLPSPVLPPDPSSPPFGYSFLNSPVIPPPPPPLTSSLPIPLGSYQQLPIISPFNNDPSSSFPQYNVKHQFPKSFHKSYKNNNASSSIINSTNIGSKSAINNSNNANKKSTTSNSNNTNSKNTNNDINDDDDDDDDNNNNNNNSNKNNNNNSNIKNTISKTIKYNSNPNTIDFKFNNSSNVVTFKGNKNNLNSNFNVNANSNTSSSNSNKKNKPTFSKPNSNRHNNSQHSKNPHNKNHLKVPCNSVIFSSSPTIPQGPGLMEMTPNPNTPLMIQNVDMNMNMGLDVPLYHIGNYNMKVGIPGIISSSQHILPLPGLNDFHIMSPPVTPPPPTLSSSYFGNKNMITNISLTPNFNGVPSNISSLNPIKSKINGGSFPSLNNTSQSTINPSSPSSPVFSFLNPINSNSNQSTMKATSNPIQVSQLYVSNEYIGCIIGKQGEIIKKIRNKSGSQIRIADVNRKNGKNSDRLITISGSTENNRIAVNIILGRIKNEKIKLMNQHQHQLKQQQQKQQQQPSPCQSPSLNPS
ncbi:hypothetical protein BCR36DRAFT_581219 [Piromyces finnis]|uniref:K Homology domain-containing protein n=1 Tax=Piromyces finnis TaxID=1754191 RepID=A0A1Y1VIB1_9FUNG|nr:hypothetical protein BCR36DRAFT_581219 [Piromyces finnis]|eukprot:ORX56073.1 hypothetical protein BCR36DRAFT_581219 [Piromyces finnis]